MTCESGITGEATFDLEIWHMSYADTHLQDMLQVIQTGMPAVGLCPLLR